MWPGRAERGGCVSLPALTSAVCRALGWKDLWALCTKREGIGSCHSINPSWCHLCPQGTPWCGMVRLIINGASPARVLSGGQGVLQGPRAQVRERWLLPGPSIGALTVVARRPTSALRPPCSSKGGGVRKAM